MNKREKILFGIGISLTVFLLIMYGLLMKLIYEQPVAVHYPEGSLSESIFVSQNNSYTKNEAFPNAYAFSAVPYCLDLPNGAMANVGRGCIIQWSDTMLIYISEHGEEDVKDVILQEVPSALLIAYDPAYTYSQEFVTQEGYINGFKARYLFDMITVSDSRRVQTAYLAAYDLSVPSEVADYFMTVAVITTKSDTVSFENCRVVLDVLVQTLRQDSKRELQQGADAIKESSEESGIQQDGEKGVQTFSYNFQNLLSEEDEDAGFTPVAIEQEYEDLFISTVTNEVVEQSEITLYNPTGEIIAERSISDDRLTVQFHIGAVTAADFGNYVLKITHYSDYQKLQVHLNDAAVINMEMDTGMEESGEAEIIGQ